MLRPEPRNVVHRVCDDGHAKKKRQYESCDHEPGERSRRAYVTIPERERGGRETRDEGKRVGADGRGVRVGNRGSAWSSPPQVGGASPFPHGLELRDEECKSVTLTPTTSRCNKVSTDCYSWKRDLTTTSEGSPARQTGGLAPSQRRRGFPSSLRAVDGEHNHGSPRGPVRQCRKRKTKSEGLSQKKVYVCRALS